MLTMASVKYSKHEEIGILTSHRKDGSRYREYDDAQRQSSAALLEARETDQLLRDFAAQLKKGLLDAVNVTLLVKIRACSD